MTANVEPFDPARHGTMVRDFVASAVPHALGFRQNQLSQEDWLALLRREDAAGGKHAVVLLSPDGVKAVVVPTVRSTPVHGTNAFLHIFGEPDSRMIAGIADRLGSENVAGFCQTLVSADAIRAQQVLLDSGAKHVEDEVFMRSANPPQPVRHERAVVIRATAAADTPSLEQLHQNGFGLDMSYTPHSFQISDGDDGFLLVAELANTVAGYCEVEKSGSNWWIDGLVVSESVRRTGVGTGLLASALNNIPSGASVILNVSSRNSAAIELYRKFGFGEYRRERRYVLPAAPAVQR